MKPMNGEWSLEVLYKGYDDPAFEEDLKHLDERTVQIQELAAGLKDRSGKEAVLEVIKAREEYLVLFRRLYCFVMLRQSTNTTDPETAKYMDFLPESSRRLPLLGSGFSRTALPILLKTAHPYACRVPPVPLWSMQCHCKNSFPHTKNPHCL